MQIAKAGAIVAVSIGLASSVGAGAAGVLVDAINRRRGFSAQRSALFAAAMPTLSTLFGAIAFLSPSTGVTVIFLILLGVVIAAYNGPANGLLVTVSDKRVRGLSVAIMQFGANLVGFGLGPVFIGEISEALGGGPALRWGMVAVLGFYLWAALHFLLAGAALRRQALR
jgi:MFS family permease